MTDKMLIEVDKKDLISLILGIDNENYDSRFINSLPTYLKEYGMWSSAGWETGGIGVFGR